MQTALSLQAKPFTSVTPQYPDRRAFKRTRTSWKACNDQRSPITSEDPLQLCNLNRRAALAGAAAMLTLAPSASALEKKSESAPRIGEIQHTEEEWRKLLSPSAYRVLRQGGTELPTSSPLNREKRNGTFKCGACDSPLFDSSAKFESGTGWPSFTRAVNNAVTELPDYSIPFYARTEVRCTRCGGHIGHVFPDGPPPTGMRYCMNGAALTFELAPGAA